VESDIVPRKAHKNAHFSKADAVGLYRARKANSRAKAPVGARNARGTPGTPLSLILLKADCRNLAFYKPGYPGTPEPDGVDAYVASTPGLSCQPWRLCEAAEKRLGWSETKEAANWGGLSLTWEDASLLPQL
jgi:hypothetical protein